MNISTELYIKTGIDTDQITYPYKRAELFDFEDINITSKIQDVKDISKIFTDFTKEFSVPASKSNNLIFKHYYDINVENSFDARFKVDAFIKLDGVDYKKGKLSLLSVAMEHQRPKSYKLVFYGETVSLNDIIGDDELKDLATVVSTGDPSSVFAKYKFVSDPVVTLDGFEKGYVWDDVLDSLRTPVGAERAELCFPFISAENYYYYDDNVASASPSEGNSESRNVINSASADPKPRGVSWLDLKPAISVDIILQAIEERYALTFNRDDFLNVSNKVYSELFLWLSREKGNIKEQINVDSLSFNLNDFTPNSQPAWSGGNDFFVNLDQFYYLDIYIVPQNANDVYDITVESGSGDDYVALNQVGTQDFFLRYEVGSDLVNGTSSTIEPKIKVSSTGSMSQFNIDIRLQQYERSFNYFTNEFVDDLVNEYQFVDRDEAYGSGGGVQIGTQMPKMKVIDFITSLFKMFNLTAYFKDGEIIVETLDEYYKKGIDYDITKHIDTTKAIIKRNKLYSEVNMEFAEAKTFAITKSNEITGDDFGNEKLRNVFQNEDLRDFLDFDGGTYNVKVKFERMMFERMTDQGDESLTPYQWGWSVNKDQNTVITKPILFFPERKFLLGADEMGFDKSPIGTYNPLDLTSVSSYIMPANVQVDTQQSIHFGSEFDEFYGIPVQDSLVKMYYLNYILTVYDKSSRIFNTTAYLPSNLVTDVKLNDVLVIDDIRYRINKMDINLDKGKAELELFNDLGYYDEVVVPDFSPLVTDLIISVTADSGFYKQQNGINEMLINLDSIE